MTFGKIILPGRLGQAQGEIPTAVQGSRETVSLKLVRPDGAPFDLTGAVLTGTFAAGDDVYEVTGDLTPNVDQTGDKMGLFAWARSVADVGTAGEYQVQVHVSKGGLPYKSFGAAWTVAASQDATAVAPPGMVGVSQEDADWLAAGRAQVADGANLAARDADGVAGNLTVLDAAGNAVDAGYDGSAFDAAGSAAAAQAFAIQRANHTGTQTLSTISDAGTMAAQSTANYYATSAFSAAPTAAEPLKANGSGGITLKTVGVGAALQSGAVFSVHYNAGASLAGYIRESDGKFFLGQAGFAIGGGIHPLSIIHNATNASITNTIGELQIYNIANSRMRIRTNNTDVLYVEAGGGIYVQVNTAANKGIITRGASSQSANLHEWQTSAGAVLAAITANGAFQPPSLADSAASNNTIYYSTDAAKLVYKDSGGGVNALY